MWPHSISIGVGGKAISIGTDATEVVAALDPWRIVDVGGPTDYCLELHPTGADGAKVRPLPGLYHGSMTLLRTRDTSRLTTALMRVLGSHSRPAGQRQVRIGLMPVVADGVALLAPPATIGAVPDRWMAARGIEAIHTVSSLVDAGDGAVLVDPPLGSDEDPRPLVLRDWWLPPSHSNVDLSPGFAVAEVMKLVTDVTAANAASGLRAVATLVERARPTVAPHGVPAVKDGLARALQRASAP